MYVTSFVSLPEADGERVEGGRGGEGGWWWWGGVEEGAREALILYKQGDTIQIRPTSTCNGPTWLQYLGMDYKILEEE